MKTLFDHEKLAVYQETIRFVAWADDVLKEVPKGLAAHDQLDRASTSMPLNIAEGNGRFTAPDRCRFFDNARGSALECAAALDILVAKQRLASSKAGEGKEILTRIVSMLVGLIKSTSPDRAYEERAEYVTERD